MQPRTSSVAWSANRKLSHVHGHVWNIVAKPLLLPTYPPSVEHPCTRLEEVVCRTDHTSRRERSGEDKDECHQLHYPSFKLRYPTPVSDQEIKSACQCD